MDELMTMQEVSDLLRVPLATLRDWRARRKGPAGFKVGKHIRYRRSVVMQWLDDCATDSSPAA